MFCARWHSTDDEFIRQIGARNKQAGTWGNYADYSARTEQAYKRPYRLYRLQLALQIVCVCVFARATFNELNTCCGKKRTTHTINNRSFPSASLKPHSVERLRQRQTEAAAAAVALVTQLELREFGIWLNWKTSQVVDWGLTLGSVSQPASLVDTNKPAAFTYSSWISPKVGALKQQQQQQQTSTRLPLIDERWTMRVHDCASCAANRTQNEEAKKQWQ